MNTRKLMAERLANNVVSACTTQQDFQRADNGFLGDKAGDQGSGAAPIRKAKRSKCRSNPSPNQSKKAVGTVGHNVQPGIKALKEPDDDRRQKNYGKRPLQKIPCLFPKQQSNTLETREAIIGQFHDKGNWLTAKYCLHP